ncbi:Signal transduction histidine-protein kinase ArlS [compost metagenome]
MTIRLRLTLLFTALLAAIGLVWCIGMIGGLWFTLDRIAELSVHNKVQVIRDYLRDLDAERRRSGRSLALTSFDALPRAFSDDGMYLQLTTLDGEPLNSSPNLGEERLPLPARAGVSDIALPRVRPDTPPHAVMAAQPLALPGSDQIGWIQAAYPLHHHDQIIARFGLIAAGSWLAFVMLACFVAYAFAGSALRPVAAMTEEVRRMRSADEHWRLRIAHPPKDELDRLGATFNELFEYLATTFEAKRRFVADASHELKTPLTAILGNLRLISARGPNHPEEIPKWANAASREAERLGRLVDSLLVLARAGEGKLTLDRGPVDLAAIVREVATEFQTLAPRVTHTGDAASVWVLGDGDRLKQVVINLVDNAVRATREGGEVHVRTEQDGDRVRLVVEDTGIGMAPEVLPRIFDRFYRVDSARDRVHGGTGLGLAITAAIVEGHQGRIRATSTEGVGSRFEVDLPAGLQERSPGTGLLGKL